MSQWRMRRFVPKFRPVFGSLRSQLLSRTLLLLAALLLIVGVFQYLYLERFLFQNKAEAIQRQIRTVPGEMWLRFAEGIRRGRESPVLVFPSSSVIYRDAGGTVYELSADADGRSAPLLSEETYAEVLRTPGSEHNPPYRISKDSQGNEQLVVLQAVRSFRGMLGLVQVSLDTRPLKTELYRQLALYGGISLFALVLGWLLLVPVIRRTLVPLSKVAGTIERIDSGNLDERLPARQGQAEIDKLASSFNRMLERLEQSFGSEREAKEQMRRFVADASHELRTPLTSIHGFLEVLLRGAAANPEQLDRSLCSMYGESKRMGKLVGDLLLLAKLDREPELSAMPADVGEIVHEMEPQLRLLAQQREVRFDLQPLPLIPLDRDKIKQVILNLFHNAVQHTDPQQGRIHLNAKHADNSVLLTVTDNGSGIPPEHLPRIFDRFYRLDESRSRIHGGTGLGLSISRSIVELHGGTIEAESAPGAGSVFRVILPMMSKDSR